MFDASGALGCVCTSPNGASLNRLLVLPAAWLVCLRATGMPPLAMVDEGEEAQAEESPYRRYGMYLAILSARRAVEEVT